MSAEQFNVLRNLALCLGIIAGMLFLLVALCRQWVKRDLAERMCVPIRIRWRPFAWETNKMTCSFRVVYADAQGRVHRAVCWTPWLMRRVSWDRDEIVDVGQDLGA